MQEESKTNIVNQIFGNIFILLGIFLIHDPYNDFFTYNFRPHVLFVFMRPNTSIIAEFLFGVEFLLLGFFMLTKTKAWIKIIKILVVNIITYTITGFLWRIMFWVFDLDFLFRKILSALFCILIYKLTSYFLYINGYKWQLKSDKTSLITGFILGFFPYLFWNVFFN